MKEEVIFMGGGMWSELGDMLGRHLSEEVRGRFSTKNVNVGVSST